MPNYTYTTPLPVSTNSPAQDQPNMTVNNASIGSLVSVDLYGFNDNNGGYHQKSTYVVQGSDPTPVNTDGAQCILYAKTANSIAELYLTRFGSATPVQMSSGPTSTSGSFGASSVNRTFLPGGFKMQFGNIVTGGGGTGTITFSPAFSTLLSLNVSIAAGSSTATVAITGYSAASATVACNAGSQVIGYVAIGL